MQTVVTVVHIVACVFLVLVVLLQSGKGAEISASFAGSSQTVFGSSGGANFFTRFTGAMAAIFMITSLSLTIMSGSNQRGVFDEPVSGEVTTAPAGDAKQAPAAPADGAAPAQPAEKK